MKLDNFFLEKNDFLFFAQASFCNKKSNTFKFDSASVGYLWPTAIMVKTLDSCKKLTYTYIHRLLRVSTIVSSVQHYKVRSEVQAFPKIHINNLHAFPFYKKRSYKKRPIKFFNHKKRCFSKKGMNCQNVCYLKKKDAKRLMV